MVLCDLAVADTYARVPVGSHHVDARCQARGSDATECLIRVVDCRLKLCHRARRCQGADVVVAQVWRRWFWPGRFWACSGRWRCRWTGRLYPDPSGPPSIGRDVTGSTLRQRQLFSPRGRPCSRPRIAADTRICAVMSHLLVLDRPRPPMEDRLAVGYGQVPLRSRVRRRHPAQHPCLNRHAFSKFLPPSARHYSGDRFRRAWLGAAIRAGERLPTCDSGVHDDRKQIEGRTVRACEDCTTAIWLCGMVRTATGLTLDVFARPFSRPTCRLVGRSVVEPWAKS